VELNEGIWEYYCDTFKILYLNLKPMSFKIGSIFILLCVGISVLQAQDKNKTSTTPKTSPQQVPTIVTKTAEPPPQEYSQLKAAVDIAQVCSTVIALVALF
jgi:hypothetical protein